MALSLSCLPKSKIVRHFAVSYFLYIFDNFHSKRPVGRKKFYENIWVDRHVLTPSVLGIVEKNFCGDPYIFVANVLVDSEGVTPRAYISRGVMPMQNV